MLLEHIYKKFKPRFNVFYRLMHLKTLKNNHLTNFLRLMNQPTVHGASVVTSQQSGPKSKIRVRLLLS